jgi:outer membrane receptor protein involved in Fe transport
MLLMVSAATASPPARSFDIEAGPAEEGLRTFIAQSGRELLFSTRTARAVRTNAVRGDFAAEDALGLLLNGTALGFVHDEKSGVLRVIRAPAPAEPLERMTFTPIRVRRQSATAPPPADALPITLSPFSVTARQDQGYVATSTLAGSRLNSALIDTPASVSVMTREFLDDIAATNVGEALAYALNAEWDTSDGTGNPTGLNDLPVAMRGFGGAGLVRNYFEWGLESDTFNSERLDFSRGPNSILFGTGGPGGIINTTTKRAAFGREITSFGARVGAWDDYRGTFDVNREVTPQLALRVNAVRHTSRSWRDYVAATRKGAAVAITWRPLRHTQIRFDGEQGEYDRVLTNPYLPADAVTAWIQAGRPISGEYGRPVPGTVSNTGRVYIHDPDTGEVLSWFGSLNTVIAGQALSAGIGRALTDFSVLPLKGNLAGDGNRSDSRFHSAGVFLEQQFGRLWVEAAANRQSQGRLWLTSTNWGHSIVRADANAFLPDGRPNPNAGRLYVETNAQQATLDSEVDDLRLTSAYTFALGDRHPWLGDVTLTGLLSRRESRQANDTLFEVNTTPADDADYPASLASPNNRLWRRVYLDPRNGGRTGGVDARRFQVSQAGVTSGFARIQDQGTRSREVVGAAMMAGQARLWRDRIVITGGLRHDRQRSFGGTAVRDPATGVFTTQSPGATATRFSGETRTIGGVLHLTAWAGLFFNASENFVPQNTLTIEGRQLGPRLGRGQDHGIKLRLPGGRVHATLARYHTREINRQTFADGALVAAINEIYEAAGEATRVAGPTSRDSIDTEGKGHELEVTANLAPGWRLHVNVAQVEGVQSNNQPRNRAYVEGRRARWESLASRPLVAPLTGVPAIDPVTGAPATVSTALAVINSVRENILAANGVTRRQLREYTGSAFSAFTFTSEHQWLHEMTVGAGVRFRGAPVVGYRNGLTALRGRSETTLNLMFGKVIRRTQGRLRLQANLENLLNANDPIVADADETGALRLLYPTPFRWTLSALLTF